MKVINQPLSKFYTENNATTTCYVGRTFTKISTPTQRACDKFNARDKGMSALFPLFLLLEKLNTMRDLLRTENIKLICIFNPSSYYFCKHVMNM